MKRPIIFVLLAGLAALVAAMVVYTQLKKRETEVQEAMVQSVDIVVAAHDLGIGAKLDPSSVKTVRWSRDSIPPGSFTDTAALMNQFTKSSFIENEPIVQSRLFGGDKNAGVLPLLIPQGMRALSVPVDEVSDISGFVLPHTHVDVLVSVTSGDKPLAKIVLQNVEVLATAQDIEQVNDKPEPVRVVTMLVTPDQAERLTLASHEGALRLAMRNYEDKNLVVTGGIDMAQLLGAQPAAIIPVMAPQRVYAPRKPKPVDVEVLRDGKTSEHVAFVKAPSGGNAAPPADPGANLIGSDGGSAAAASPESFIDATAVFPAATPAGRSAETDRPSAPGTNAVRRARLAGSTVPTAAAPAPLTPGSLTPDPLATAGLGRGVAPVATMVAPGYTGPRSRTIDVP
ncbi:MAG: Flp pilus assembly protein CpaB [Candidatus Binataceae bacterium]|nr:Flp pilus assembly protein CpaB [Candidatus Binataceae bacterium]